MGALPRGQTPPVPYKNLPPLIGLVLDSDKATLYELKEVYTIFDLADLVENITISAINKMRAAQNGS